MEACAGPMMNWGVISEPFCVSMKVAPKRGNLIENAYIGRIIAHAFLAARAAKLTAPGYLPQPHFRVSGSTTFGK
jgi:hypothetical protein